MITTRGSKMVIPSLPALIIASSLFPHILAVQIVQRNQTSHENIPIWEIILHHFISLLGFFFRLGSTDFWLVDMIVSRRRRLRRHIVCGLRRVLSNIISKDQIYGSRFMIVRSLSKATWVRRTLVSREWSWFYRDIDDYLCSNKQNEISMNLRPKSRF